MKSIILDIFHANCEYDINAFVPRKKSEEQINRFSDVSKRLKEELSEELFRLHQDLLDEVVLDEAQDIDFFYVLGFKLGLRIGIECLSE